MAELTRIEPELLRRLTRAISREAIILADRLFELHTMDVLSRLQLELLRLCDRGGVRRSGRVVILPSPTHEALASRIGATREVVTRHMKVLRELGLLTGNRGEIIISDRERLEALVGAERE